MSEPEHCLGSIWRWRPSGPPHWIVSNAAGFWQPRRLWLRQLLRFAASSAISGDRLPHLVMTRNGCRRVRLGKSSIFLRRIVSSMFMRVNCRCAHQMRPPLTAVARASGSGAHRRMAVRTCTGRRNMKLGRLRRISPKRASRSARAYSAVRAMSMMRIRPVGLTTRAIS
jgi:hypothetical protein